MKALRIDHPDLARESLLEMAREIMGGVDWDSNSRLPLDVSRMESFSNCGIIWFDSLGWGEMDP
jgi:hypothetical protein